MTPKVGSMWYPKSGRSSERVIVLDIYENEVYYKWGNDNGKVSRTMESFLNFFRPLSKLELALC